MENKEKKKKRDNLLGKKKKKKSKQKRENGENYSNNVYTKGILLIFIVLRFKIGYFFFFNDKL